MAERVIAVSTTSVSLLVIVQRSGLITSLPCLSPAGKHAVCSGGQ